MSRQLAIFSGIVALLMLCTSAHAATKIGKQHKVGLGLGAGVVTYGLSGKLHLTEANVVMMTVGLRSGASVDLGYLQRMTMLWNGGRRGQLDLAVGAALTTWMHDWGGDDSSTIFGGRGIVELACKLGSVPLEITMEWGPSFLTGEKRFGGLCWGGGAGAVRWFF